MFISIPCINFTYRPFYQFSPATTVVGCLVERHCADVLLYIIGTHLLVFIVIHIMTFSSVLRNNLSN